MKLAAALAVPLIALSTVTFLEVARTSDDVADIREQTSLARAAIGPSGLITKLQNERTWMAVEVVGWGDVAGVPVKGYAETRAQTDEAAAMLREEIEREGGEVARAFTPALEGLAALDQIRVDIDAYAGPQDTSSATFTGPTYDRYTAVITPFFDAITDVSVAVDDPDLRQGTELADAVAREIEVLGDTIAQVLAEQLVNGSIGAEGVAWTAGKQEEFVRYGQKLQNASGPYADIVAEHFPTHLYQDVGMHLDQAITAGAVDPMAVQQSVANREDGEGFEQLQDAIATELLDRSSDLNAAAVARQRWYAALGGLTLVLATILTWLVSRSITKPLRSLTHQAKEMAEHRLPDAVLDILETPLGDDVAMPSIDPVRVNTRDEVADVADALNTVQDTALDLAVEQAVLRRNIADSFVNLGRRNQNLLGRQLDFITELETNEADPDTLANLFRLDHLATRMRRNAESLLVLAGIEPPRKWAAPVRLTDVIRAALGEVEDYQRVTVRGVEPATILGSAAADLAHLLAELIENALVFSPPDQTVDIRGRNRPDGYTLAIIDSGLGMPATDVNAANRRLAGAESFTIAPSKYLGHYVAGNLAARHNIHVHLDNSPGNGITATIDIPPTLLTTEYAQPQEDEPHAAREVWPPAPREVDPGDAPPAALPPPGPGRLPATHSHLPAARTAYPMGAPPAGGARPPILDSPAAAAAAAHALDATSTTAAPPGGGIGRPLAYPRAQFGAVPPGPAPSLPAPAAPAPPPTNLAGPPPAPAWPGGAPAAAAPGGFTAAPASAAPPDPAVEARRTASGLVKRTPRVVDTGSVPAMRNEPSEDLLRSLSRYTQGRESATGSIPAAPSPAGTPPLPARRPGTGAAIPTRGNVGASAPPVPGVGTPASGPALPSRHPGSGNGSPSQPATAFLTPATPAPNDPSASPPPLAARAPGDPFATQPPHPGPPFTTTPGTPASADPFTTAPGTPAPNDPSASPPGQAPTSPSHPGSPFTTTSGTPAPNDPFASPPPLAARAPGDPFTGTPGQPPANPGQPPPPLAARRGNGGPGLPPLAARSPGSGNGASGLPSRSSGGGRAIPTRGNIGASAPPLPGFTASGSSVPGGPGGPPPAWLTSTPPPASPEPRRTRTTGSNPTLGSLLASLTQPAFNPRQQPHGRPPADPAESAGVTSGGLTRRVRGAQLPSATPHAVRRPPAGPAPGPAPASPPPATRSADAVYSFLTSFSAGVQRGLDETRPKN